MQTPFHFRVPSALGALVTALLLVVPSVRAQQGGTITGRVVDASTGQAIAAVQVFISALDIGGLTQQSGRYLLQNVPAGTHTLSVSRIGYRTTEAEVTVAGGQTVEQNFSLAGEALQLEAIVVTGTPGGTQRRAIGHAVVSVSAISLTRAALDRQRSGRVLRQRYNPDFEREGYDRIYENEFMAVSANPLSTFGIDVDRASYSNVRRFIRDGRLPPADAVRIEELINYFTYDLPSPEGPDPFSVHTEVGPAPWNPMHRLVRIGIQGRRIDTEDLPPSNLVFLVDVSGSMRPANKLPLLKSALGMLVNQMRPQDRVAIVVYAGAAGLVLDPTSGADKETILEALSRLEAGGSTAGGAGLRLAYDVARRHHMEGGNNRVILATDGDFNIGPSSDAEMIRLIEDRRDQGTFLTVLGFGTGNLQDAKMEQIADHVNGNFAYIDSVHEAHKVLVREFGGTLYTIAKDVKLQVEFNPARVQAYRLIGYENRMLAAEDFNDDRKDSGDLGAGHTVTALYEVIPTGVESSTLVRGLDVLRYQRTDESVAISESQEMLFVKLRYKDPNGNRSRLLSTAVSDVDAAREIDGSPSSDFTFAASVAAFGMVLRDSKYGGTADLRAVLRWARSSVGPDHEGYRREFVRMVEAAARLSDQAL